MKKLAILLLSILMILPAESAGIEIPQINILNILQSIDNLTPELRRGGSFGGRRSFGRSRSRSRSKSFGGSRSKNRRSNYSRNKTLNHSPKRPSFGGKRMKPADARKKYGTPRKSTPVTQKSGSGASTNYVMHSYGGYGSGLMTGYMMGTSSWMWFTPFHPAFYYSRPIYVTNEDGSVGVYPPTFSWSRIFFIVMIIGVIVWYFQKRRIEKVRYQNHGSFA